MPTDLCELVANCFRQSIEIPVRFFEENADRLSQASLEMARRFKRGGRLLAFGSGSSVTDAQHVAVEFVHPVIVGKRALPAIALTNDIASILGFAQSDGVGEVFARPLRLLGKKNDIALGLATEDDASVARGLEAARQMGMLTIGMSGQGSALAAEYGFAVPSSNSRVVQEVQETAYHILWETVHVFLEHQELLDGQ